VYGIAPPSLVQFVPKETTVEVGAQDLLTQDKAFKQLKYHWRGPKIKW